MNLHRKMISAAIIALAGTLSVQTAWAGPAVTGCQHNIKPGKFRFAAKCRANETLVTLQTMTVTGPAGPQGPAGPTGPAGAQGPAGPGISGFGGFGSQIGAVPSGGNNASYQPVATPYTFEVKSMQQSVWVYATGTFGTRGDGGATIAPGICFQRDAENAEIWSTPMDYEDTITKEDGKVTRGVAGGWTGFSPGIYKVGYCLANKGPNALDNNDWVNGWVMITE